MKTILANIVGGVAVFGVLFFALDKALSVPDVKFSYSTDSCVEVINYNEDDKYSCENLPTKFNHIWVE